MQHLPVTLFQLLLLILSMQRIHAQTIPFDTLKYYSISNCKNGSGYDLTVYKANQEASKYWVRLDSIKLDSSQLWTIDKEYYGNRITNLKLGQKFSLDCFSDGKNLVAMLDSGSYTGQWWIMNPQVNGSYTLTNTFMGPNKPLRSDMKFGSLTDPDIYWNITEVPWLGHATTCELYVCDSSATSPTSSPYIMGALNFYTGKPAIVSAGIETKLVEGGGFTKADTSYTTTSFGLSVIGLVAGVNYDARIYYTFDDGSVMYSKTYTFLTGASSTTPSNCKPWNYKYDAFWSDPSVGGSGNLCGNGMQSPIPLYDMFSAIKTTLPTIDTGYIKFPVELVDNGHTLMVSQGTNPGNVSRLKRSVIEDLSSELRGAEDPKNGITHGSDFYSFLQVHFHTPCEHTLNGVDMPMEFHIVHHANGKYLVLTVMVQLSTNTTSNLNQVLDSIAVRWPTQINKKDYPPNFSISMADLIAGCDLTDYYTYDGGSLTTPPGTPATFLILKKPLYITQDVLSKFQSKFHNDNARSLQRYNGRKMYRSK